MSGIPWGFVKPQSDEGGGCSATALEGLDATHADWCGGMGPRTTWFASRSLGSDDPPGPAGAHPAQTCPKSAIHAIVLGKAYFRLLHNRCEFAPVLGKEATGPWC
jgi:hypothetical protein